MKKILKVLVFLTVVVPWVAAAGTGEVFSSV